MIPVKPHVAALSRVRSREEYERMYAESVADPAAFWLREAARLDWTAKPTVAFDVEPASADFAWFPDGTLNVAANCVDRHARATPDKTAIVWAGNDPGQYRRISFRELQLDVGRMANVLKAHGVRKGDRVCIYLPMIPELAVAMLACARIGAVHSVVFAGFSAEALRGRIEDAGARVLITADEGVRGARHIPLKHVVDEALHYGGPVATVLVAKRTGLDVAMRAGRDLWLEDELAKQRAFCPPEPMNAEDPLFILYTSGSTGRPKGVLHTTGGYLVYAAATFAWVFDARPDDVHFCAADCGWITGHSYIVYGPLCNGVTTVMFESLPTWPDPGRYWQVVDDVGATTFYTAPTALRALLREGDAHVRKHRRTSIRVLGSVGEPINPEVWRWYHDVVGEGRCAVVDTWWQTETGGVLVTTLPGALPSEPGAAGLPMPGVRPVLLDEHGQPAEESGNLCLAGAWPGQARTLFGDHARFRDTYWRAYPGLYFTGDGARRDANGYWWITGRVDDVLNVAGHRLGTAEIESALVAHEAVAEAAVVGVPHDLKGTAILAYVIVKPGWEVEPSALRDHVRHTISPIASPDRVVIVPGLPKTRSGKIMRRILRKIGEGELGSLGDTSTLADPGVVDEIVAVVRGGA
ncbi:MAG: acetate--CoA ligase [Myxococcota bacterium]